MQQHFQLTITAEAADNDQIADAMLATRAPSQALQAELEKLGLSHVVVERRAVRKKEKVAAEAPIVPLRHGRAEG